METDFPIDLVDHSHGSCVVELVNYSKPRGGVSTYEQRFLLYFILGVYLGPDVTSEVPRKSALQREAEGLPPYTSDMLGGSVFRLSEIENVYYYVLRNAHPSACVKLQSLYKFLQGNLASPVKKILDDERQFPSLFPPHLHRHSRYKGTYKVVENLVFTESPVISSLKAEDVDTFKRLSRLTELAVDRQEACSYQHGHRNDRGEERSARYNLSLEYQTPGQVERPILMPGQVVNYQRKRKRKQQVDCLSPPTAFLSREDKSYMAPNRGVGAAIFLPSLLTLERWNEMMNEAKPALHFAGTVATCQAGPLIGLVDIYECDDAYLFRCSLPGVKKQESPVEPLSPTANFRNDGILEALVMKQRARIGKASLTFES
eukprot:c24926_g1_i2 orf=287-1405(-)